MKLIIAWLRKDGSCRRWTNSKPHEHVAMSLNVYADAMKRLGKEWRCSAYEAAETVNKFFKSKENQTNADRIRSMTDEELAEFLAETVWRLGENIISCKNSPLYPECVDDMCYECPCYLEWLKSPRKRGINE